MGKGDAIPFAALPFFRGGIFLLSPEKKANPTNPEERVGFVKRVEIVE